MACARHLAQPEIEGGVSVARRQVCIVIVRLAVERVAAVRLDRCDRSAVVREARMVMVVSDGSSSGAPQAATILARASASVNRRL